MAEYQFHMASLIIKPDRNSGFRCEPDTQLLTPRMTTEVETVRSKRETARIVKFGLFFTSPSLQFKDAKQVIISTVHEQSKAMKSSQVSQASQISQISDERSRYR